MIEEWNDNPDGSGFNYPVLRVIARKTCNPDKKICPNSTLSRTAIADYLERKDLFIRLHVRPLEDKIVQWHTLGKRMALFGGGPHTAELLQVLKIPNNSFICAFDNDPLKWGKTVGNVGIVPPKDIDRYKPDIVIISSREFENEIADSLKKQRESGITVVKIYNG
jgi:FlaA1/EpsC-like NDP-sugar epimerase